MEVQKLENSLNIIIQKLDGLSGDVSELKEGQNRLEARIGGLEAKVDNLEAKVDKLEVRVTNLEQGQLEMRKDIAAIRRDQFGFRQDLAQALGMVFDIHERTMSELQHKIAR